MGIWIYRTNTDESKDPDWGKKAHYSNCILKVIVEPKNGEDWIFFLILPSGDNNKEAVILSQQACENFLSQGDQYTVTELCEQDVKDFHNAMPILIHHPYSRGEFLWIVPPTAIKN